MITTTPPTSQNWGGKKQEKKPLILMCFEKCFFEKKREGFISGFFIAHIIIITIVIIQLYPLIQGFCTYHKPYERCQKLVVYAIYTKLYNKIILSHNWIHDSTQLCMISLTNYENELDKRMPCLVVAWMGLNSLHSNFDKCTRKWSCHLNRSRPPTIVPPKYHRICHHRVKLLLYLCPSLP